MPRWRSRSISFFLDGGAFVELFFAVADGEFELGAAFFEVDGEGDEGGAFFLGGVFEALDFAFVDEELAGAEGFVVVDGGGLFVVVDVEVVEPELAVFDAGEGVVHLGEAAAEGFDLGAFEGDAALELGVDVVIVEGAAVFDARGEVGWFAGHPSTMIRGQACNAKTASIQSAAA